MIKNILLLLTLYVSFAYSRRAIFKLIAIGTNAQVQVIDGALYKLSLAGTDEILFNRQVGTAPDGDFQYYYIVDGVKEEFTRTYTASQTTTLNDFFGRQQTVKKLNQFSYPYNNWKRTLGVTDLFDTSYIPTIHITGKEVDAFFSKPDSSYHTIEKVTFYLKQQTVTATNVVISAKNKNTPKFQVRMQFNKTVFGRNVLKLRNSGEDPTNLRQFIYGNMIQAIGMPSIHSNMVRVYYNKKPFGFYVLQDEAYSEGFLRTEFYGKDTSAPVGCAYDGTCGADVEYPIGETYGPFDVKICNTKLYLTKFGEYLNALNPTNQKKLNNFERNWFDIDTFHKAMAMEFLTGDWDGYWFATSNYVLYNDISENPADGIYKFYFLTQDHDETFGVGLEPPHNRWGYNFPKQSYRTTMLNSTWIPIADAPPHRILVDKFISGSPELQQRFETTLKNIVKYIFNPVAFDNVVNSYFKRYRPEMKWDHSFKRAYNPNKSNAPPAYTYADGVTNKDEPVLGIRWGITEFVRLRAEAIQKEFGVKW